MYSLHAVRRLTHHLMVRSRCIRAKGGSAASTSWWERRAGAAISLNRKPGVYSQEPNLAINKSSMSCVALYICTPGADTGQTSPEGRRPSSLPPLVGRLRKHFIAGDLPPTVQLASSSANFRLHSTTMTTLTITTLAQQLKSSAFTGGVRGRLISKHLGLVKPGAWEEIKSSALVAVLFEQPMTNDQGGFEARILSFNCFLQDSREHVLRSSTCAFKLSFWWQLGR